MNEDVTARCAGSSVIALNKKLDSQLRKELTETIIFQSCPVRRQLLLIIDCQGGDIEEALQLYDVIKAAPIRITGFVVGECCSSAMLILQACAIRVALPHARFMCHTLTFRHVARISEASLDHFRIDLAERAETDREFRRLLALRLPNKSVIEEFIDLGDHQQTFSAEQAKEAGFLDDVIDDLSPFMKQKEAA